MDKDVAFIYAKYYQSVYRYLLSLSNNKDIAEDITAETFLKVIKNINKYDPKYNMLTWICNIAKNTYYTEYKKNKRFTSLDEDVKDNEKDIINKMIASETNREILKVVHSLEEPYKEVFTLRVYGNLSFSDIASIFNKTESWARVTFYRSKIKIKDGLDEKEL